MIQSNSYFFSVPMNVFNVKPVSQKQIGESLSDLWIFHEWWFIYYCLFSGPVDAQRVDDDGYWASYLQDLSSFCLGSLLMTMRWLCLLVVNFVTAMSLSDAAVRSFAEALKVNNTLTQLEIFCLLVTRIFRWLILHVFRRVADGSWDCCHHKCIENKH